LKPRIAILAGLLALVGAGAAEAQAIYVGPRYYDPGLPPYEIVRIVRANGLAPLSRPVRRGPTYMLAASDRSGRQLRVVVDARSGEILTVTPVLAMRSYGPWLASPYDPRILPVPPAAIPPPDAPPPAISGPGAGFDGGLPPVPPRPVPNARLANAPTAVVPAAVTPPHVVAPQAQRTPMPRPRPQVASSGSPAAQSGPAAQPPVQTQAAPPQASKENTPPNPAEMKLVPVAPLE